MGGLPRPVGSPDIEDHPAYVRFVRYRLGKQLHHHFLRGPEQLSGRAPRFRWRPRNDRLRYGDTIGGDSRLGLRLGKHAAAFHRRPAEDGEHGVAIAGDVLAAARGDTRQRLLRSRPVGKIGYGARRIGRCRETRYAGVLQDTARLARRMFAEP